jgi:chaperonin GroEL
MNKIIKFGKEGKRELKKGVDVVGNAIKPTIGPKGLNVVFDRGFGGPQITNDGGSISREIILRDPIQNAGANLEKEVAQKTNDTAGDGRKTTILLYQAIVEEGMKQIAGSRWNSLKRLLSFKSTKVNPIGVRSGIEKAAKIAVDYLKTISKPIKTEEEINQVAVISSKSVEIGKVISDTMKQLGTNSVVTVEESPIVGIQSEVSQGLELDKGYVSPYMVTDPNRMEAECKDVSILVTDLKVGIIDEIVPLLEEVMASGKRELVIIAEDVTGEALNTFIINKMRGGLTVLGIKAPGFGTRKKDYLEDIATVVGATFISSDIYTNLGNVKVADLGSADRVVSTKDKTTIVGGRGTKEAIESRIAVIKNELSGLESKHDQLKVAERLAKMTGGVAIIKIGAATETETKYLKLKTEDAVNAVKAALEEGVLPGGGSALILASKAILEAYTANKNDYTSDELIGFSIMAKALEIPLKCIAVNCGLGDGLEVVRIVKTQGGMGGFDAMGNTYTPNMIEIGIIDPTKVERCAIENASSGASMLLTTEVAIATEEAPLK